MPTLNWIGKDAVVNHHHDVPFRTLEKEYTFGADDSDNKIIHGDNLEALKALLPEYEGRIKCIYIDPPYNTGNENWVYNDNVNSPKIRKWLGQVVGKEAEDLTRHDKWLCMMYPRLKLLQRLLSDDGAIFISIDDNEQANLKLICDEIFGTGNNISSIVWKRKRGRDNSAKWFSKSHEYMLVYAKNSNLFCVNKLELDEETKKAYKNPDNDSRGAYRMLGTWARGTQGGVKYDFTTKDGKYFNERLWLMGKEKLEQLDNDNKLIIRGDNIYRKMFIYENEGKIPESLWDDTSNAANASDEIKKLFGQIVFDTPKPIPYILRIIQIVTDKSSIILDSFAGSGTTAHAVLNLNKQDGGNRKFILVEMEDYAENITAERVRRVIKGYGEDKNAVEGTGGSFSFYELGEPVFNEDGYMNEKIGREKLCEYIWYTETRTPYATAIQPNKYLLGIHQDTSYYFYYEPEKITTLSLDTLNIISEKAETYVVYADQCVIDKEWLSAHNIIFKKIPRDISRF